MNSFTTPVLTGGLGWTLTTYALKYLNELETTYGRRTGVLPYGGVELIPSGRPNVWYPFEAYIVARLHDSVLNSLPQAIFQLSHEMVHVLCDGGPHKTAIQLEEGFAVWFSKLATDRDSGYPNYADVSIAADVTYQGAFNLVTQLLGIDSDAIKKLRGVQPKLGSVSAADFKSAGLVVPDTLVSDLLAPF